jgi:hypothetical protein
MENFGPDPEIKEPSLFEVQETIKELKNNKAPGEDNITAELLKCGGAHLWRKTHELITEIWRTEIMSKEWSVAVICPIHKKNEKTICSNYRGISLLSVIYTVLSKILAKRLNPYTEDILGDYQCGFRRDRSTTDQIFALKNILEKCYEYNITLHQLFIDFKQAYENVTRNTLYSIMRQFQIPKKLISLVQMTLKRYDREG